MITTQWFSFSSRLAIERSIKLYEGSFTVLIFRYPVAEWHVVSQYTKNIL